MYLLGLRVYIEYYIYIVYPSIFSVSNGTGTHSLLNKPSEKKVNNRKTFNKMKIANL